MDKSKLMDQEAVTIEKVSNGGKRYPSQDNNIEVLFCCFGQNRPSK